MDVNFHGFIILFKDHVIIHVNFMYFHESIIYEPKKQSDTILNAGYLLEIVFLVHLNWLSTLI